jgi:hypothetical protein
VVDPLPSAALYEPVPAGGGLFSSFAWQRATRLAAVGLLLVTVVFFAVYPDALVTLLAYAASTAVAVFLCWYGLKVTFAPSRGRSRSRSRRRR